MLRFMESKRVRQTLRRQVSFEATPRLCSLNLLGGGKAPCPSGRILLLNAQTFHGSRGTERSAHQGRTDFKREDVLDHVMFWFSCADRQVKTHRSPFSLWNLAGFGRG